MPTGAISGQLQRSNQRSSQSLDTIGGFLEFATAIDIISGYQLPPWSLTWDQLRLVDQIDLPWIPDDRFSFLQKTTHVLTRTATTSLSLITYVSHVSNSTYTTQTPSNAVRTVCYTASYH